MKVRTRIILSFLAFGAFIIIASILSVQPIENQLKHVGSFRSDALYSIQHLNSKLNQAVEESFAYVVSGDSHEKEEFLQWMEQFKQDPKKFLPSSEEVIEELGGDREAEEKILYDKIISEQSILVKQAKIMFEEYEQTGAVSSQTFQQYEKSIDSISANLDKAVEIQKEEVEHLQVIALDAIDQYQKTIYGIAILSLILATGLGLIISRTIYIPLVKLQQALVAVGKGDFSMKIEISSQDEIGMLNTFFNKMVNNLEKTTVSRDMLESANTALKDEILHRKSTEQLIIRERQNLYNMLDSLPMAFHLQAPDYSVPFANKVFHELFGDPQKKNCYSLMHQRTEPCEVCEPFKVFDHKNNEVSIWQSLNGRTYITVCTPFTDVDGSPLVMEMALDITEEENAKKDAILAKEEAEKASRAKSEFLTHMSHEFRTPMNAILGFSQLLEMDKEYPLNPFQKSQVHHILKAGGHLLELINHVLDLSRIESGHISLSTEEVRAFSVISEVLELLRPLLKEKNLSFKTVSLKTSDISVLSDRVRLKQILLNIISNAIKYNRQGGSISVTLQKLENKKVQISVEDTGVGISPKNLETIFHPFQRVESKTETVEGTGVGLTISKRLVELMNSSLEVQSEEGKGSCFSIILPEGKDFIPLEEPEPIAEPDSISYKNWGNGFKVLYIEDNPANMDLVASILFRHDLKLLQAPDAKLGIELAKAHQPDLILMDINLPGMDGYEALKIIRSEPSLGSTPVIAISANCLDSDIKKGLAAGFNEYVSKPIQITSFLKKINSFLPLR
jgi:signal transduction histidine kinase/CheY-like chemotaxis protein/HAMP domain-containing protein